MSHPHPGAPRPRAGAAARGRTSVPASEFGAALRRPAGLDGYDPDDRVDPIDPSPITWPGGQPR